MKQNDHQLRMSKVIVNILSVYINMFPDSYIKKRNRDVLIAYIGGETAKNIGERLGITERRVIQIVQAAVRKVRERSENYYAKSLALEAENDKLKREINKLRYSREQLHGHKDTPDKTGVLLKDSGLSKRVLRLLRIHKNGIDTINELSMISRSELKRIPSFGRSAMTEVEDTLAKFGYKIC